MELRPYQKEAVSAVLKEWNEGRKRTLLVLPTGTGKTVVFSKLASEVTKQDKRTLILAHREELLNQAQDKLFNATGLSSSVEKTESTCIGSALPVTVGSVQTMCRESRLSKFNPDYFDNIIVDEAHHCLSDSYQKVLNHFPEAKVLGVTATPDRGDHKDLATFFDSKAYEYGMAQAIKDGYLCPIKAEMIPLNVDLTNVSISAGDYSAGDVGIALDPYLEQIAIEMAKRCQNRKTVVFLPLIQTSQKFCELLNSVGLKSAEVNGESDDRADILANFEAGKYQVLCNSMLLTEGWDCPSVDCVVILRPTKMRGLYQQMVGRGMRLSEGKEYLLLLDFLWLTTRHDLAKPSSLMCKDKKIAERVDKMLESKDEERDLTEAEDQAEKDAALEREQALARELEISRKKKAQLVDPIQYAMSIADEDLADFEPIYMWEMQPASPKQIAYLEKMGISSETVQNMGYASMLIDKLAKRLNAGLASPKQIRLLERYGFQHVGNWNRSIASEMITRIANNRWFVPRDIDPTTFEPKTMEAKADEWIPF